MPSQIAKYEVKDGVTPLGALFFNAVFRDLDLRLVSLEALQADWNAAIEELRRFGLQRINGALEANFAAINELTAQAGATLADVERRVDELTIEAEAAVTAANQAVDTANAAVPALQASVTATETAASQAAASVAAAVATATDEQNSAFLVAFALG